MWGRGKCISKRGGGGSAEEVRGNWSTVSYERVLCTCMVVYSRSVLKCVRVEAVWTSCAGKRGQIRGRREADKHARFGGGRGGGVPLSRTGPPRRMHNQRRAPSRLFPRCIVPAGTPQCAFACSSVSRNRDRIPCVQYFVCFVFPFLIVVLFFFFFLWCRWKGTRRARGASHRTCSPSDTELTTRCSASASRRWARGQRGMFFMK